MAKAGLLGLPPRLAVVHITADRDADEALASLSDSVPGVPCVGCTSCGGVLRASGAAGAGVSVLLLAGVGAGEFAAAGADKGGFEGGKEVAERVVEEVGEAGFCFLMGVPGGEEDVLRGVQSVVGEVPVFGGSAADEDLSGSWRVFGGGMGSSAEGVVLVGIKAGGVKAGAALVSPYLETERDVEVTDCEERTIVSLGGRPAADVLYEMVGDAVGEEYRNGGLTLGPMSTRPYALRRGGDLIAVHVAAINQPAGSVDLFAEVETGDRFVAMENSGGGDSASAAGIAIRDAYEGAKRAAGMQGDPGVAMMVYCGGLGMAVGDKLERNLKDDFAELQGLPAGAVGFTAFGEQGPCECAEGVKNMHRNLSVGMMVMQ